MFFFLLSSECHCFSNACSAVTVLSFLPESTHRETPAQAQACATVTPDKAQIAQLRGKSVAGFIMQWDVIMEARGTD